MIQKIEVERFTLRSSKPFDEVVAALNSAVGHPDMAEFWKSTHSAQSECRTTEHNRKRPRANRTDVVCGIRSRRNRAQKNRSRYTEDDLERFFAKRMGATAYELDSSHVPMLSQPNVVLDVIRAAAKSVNAA